MNKLTKEAVLQGKYAISAPTIEDAKKIVDMFPEVFKDNGEYVRCWSYYKKETSYAPNIGEYCTCDFYRDKYGYTIITLSDITPTPIDKQEVDGIDPITEQLRTHIASLTRDEFRKEWEDITGHSISNNEVDGRIREEADKWVFEENGAKWSNNDDTAGDNHGSFIAGANFYRSLQPINGIDWDKVKVVLTHLAFNRINVLTALNAIKQSLSPVEKQAGEKANDCVNCTCRDIEDCIDRQPAPTTPALLPLEEDAAIDWEVFQNRVQDILEEDIVSSTESVNQIGENIVNMVRDNYKLSVMP